MKNILSLFAVFWEILKLEHLTIEMSGDNECRALYEIINSPHPRFKIIKYKAWGVALLKIPDSPESFLEGKDKHDIRTKLNKCARLGFKFDLVDSHERMQEIIDINTSMPMRQGRPMLSAYVDNKSLEEYFQKWPKIYGVLDSQGILRAYSTVRECGEVAIINRLLGHADNLKDGIMYFLLVEILKKQIENRKLNGQPVWFMYDIFYTRAHGLQFFKEKMGFKPYIIKWKWIDKKA